MFLSCYNGARMVCVKKNLFLNIFSREDARKLTESEIEEEGKKFLLACTNGDAEHVKKCLDSFNTSVLNRINADNYDLTGLHYACAYAQLDVLKLLVNHQQINLNVKNRWGYSALAYCIVNKEVATVLLESGKLNFQGMNRVKNFAESENGSFQFEFNDIYGNNYLIKMDSPTSLNSIKKL